MDSRIGLDYIVENAEYTTKLGAGKCQMFSVTNSLKCLSAKLDFTFFLKLLKVNGL